jgi:hypothetical protein
MVVCGGDGVLIAFRAPMESACGIKYTGFNSGYLNSV